MLELGGVLMSELAPGPTPMQEGALQLRELFMAYVEAGFSEYQACLIIGTWFAQSGRGGIEKNE